MVSFRVVLSVGAAPAETYGPVSWVQAREAVAKFLAWNAGRVAALDDDNGDAARIMALVDRIRKFQQHQLPFDVEFVSERWPDHPLRASVKHEKVRAAV